MKKVLVVLLILVMVFAMAGCGKEKVPTYKLGLGVYAFVSAGDCANATEDKDGKVQTNGQGAAIVVDEAGKIVACKIDCAQINVAVTSEGVVQNKDQAVKTKKEKKTDYNMVKYSNATLEWYEQAAIFEQYVVGKTLDEIKTLADSDSYGPADLKTAGCTIKIEDFTKAVEDAFEHLADINGAYSFVELGIYSNIASSTDATEDKDGQVFTTDTYAAVAYDQKGVVLACQINANQTKVGINNKGEYLATPDDVTTKKDLKEDYGMQKASKLEKGEWYQQIAAFEAGVVGMTKNDAKAVAGDDGKPNNDAILAGCTMKVADFTNAIKRAQ